MTRHLAKPITIRGVTYGSRKEAASALGVCAVTVSDAVANGREDFIGLGTGTTNKKPITIRGVTYESMIDSARKLGVHPVTISNARSQGKLHRVGMRHINYKDAPTKPLDIPFMTKDKNNETA